MTGSVVALSGGIGGAKLALGLYRSLAPGTLTVVANPGDDFEHLGLTVCPDFDTVLYTLAGIVNTETGWGRADESWAFMQSLADIGGETWFQLGDRDLALHVERTRRLAVGERLTQIATGVTEKLGIAASLLPVTDTPVRTMVLTADGELAFQHYFVRDRAIPVVTGFRFDGARDAALTPQVIAALNQPDLRAVVICPSNPYISIDPLLAVPGMRDLLRNAAPVIAVSPVIAGAAVKGPTAKMMQELGRPVNAATVAAHYGDIIDGFVLDSRDEMLQSEVDCPVLVTNTLMTTLEDRDDLARAVMTFAAELT